MVYRNLPSRSTMVPLDFLNRNNEHNGQPGNI